VFWQYSAQINTKDSGKEGEYLRKIGQETMGKVEAGECHRGLV
jgi:hypothetical protein